MARCRECDKARSKAYYLANRETLLAQARARREPPASATCQECGDTFKPSQNDQRFCGTRRCIDARYRRLIPRRTRRNRQASTSAASCTPGAGHRPDLAVVALRLRSQHPPELKNQGMVAFSDAARKVDCAVLAGCLASQFARPPPGAGRKSQEGYPKHCGVRRCRQRLTRDRPPGMRGESAGLRKLRTSRVGGSVRFAARACGARSSRG